MTAHDNGASDDAKVSSQPIPRHVLAMVLRDQMRREAEASVALDRDSDVHTCHAECQHPACVARRERDAQTDSGEAS